VHTPSANMYVNPSWNKGVSLAKNDVLCFCNDDIDFDVTILSDLYKFISNNGGLLGPSENCFSKKNIISKLKTKILFERTYGYGTLMLICKCDFITIPDNLKIWYGDDYLFHSQSKKNHSFTGVFIETIMETTSSLSQFNLIKNEDFAIYPYKFYSPYIEKHKLLYYFYKLVNRIYLFNV
jgi:hypothetical protein